jgi:transposase
VAGGRPCELTDAVREKIVKAISLGASTEAAARAGGAHHVTFRRWMIRGEADLECGRDTPHAALYDAVTAAEARLEQKMVKRWDKLMDGEWTAIATFLERRFPDRWSKRESVVIDVRVRKELEGMLAALEAGLTRAEFEKVIGVLADSDTRAALPAEVEVIEARPDR